MMDDLINRAEAIDALGDMPMSWTDTDAEIQAQEDWKKYRDALLNLPSAQTELSDEEKRIVKKLRTYHNGSYAKVIDRLVASAQPMRKKGKWVSPFGIGCVCNCCGYDINEHGIDIRVDGKPNFCPHCGSYNGGDADEPI